MFFCHMATDYSDCEDPTARSPVDDEIEFTQKKAEEPRNNFKKNKQLQQPMISANKGSHYGSSNIAFCLVTSLRATGLVGATTTRYLYNICILCMLEYSSILTYITSRRCTSQIG